MYKKILRIKTNSSFLINWLKSSKNTFPDSFEENQKRYRLKMTYFNGYENSKRDHIIYPRFDFSAKEIIEEALENLLGNPTQGKSSILEIGKKIEVIEFKSKHIGMDRVSPNQTLGNTTLGKTLGSISIQDIGTDITLAEFESIHTTIDKIFKEMIKNITKLWEIELDETAKSKVTNNAKKIYVPIREKSLERWKDIYSIYLDMKEEYEAAYEEEETNNPNVTKADLISRVGTELDWKPSEKTIERILKAGNAGLLNQ